MATDYEQFYQDNPCGLGEPSREFVAFFDQYTKHPCNVLDVGCGQGRDALFIARLGHCVTGVDLSPTGINNLTSDANSEGLNFTGVVADVRDYTWHGQFDVIIIDRTFHMITPEERAEVLRDLLGVARSGTHILIADERSNIPSLRVVFEESQWDWATTYAQKGYLFMVCL